MTGTDGKSYPAKVITESRTVESTKVERDVSTVQNGRFAAEALSAGGGRFG